VTNFRFPDCPQKTDSSVEVLAELMKLLFEIAKFFGSFLLPFRYLYQLLLKD
jgi:hypothetical protein